MQIYHLPSGECAIVPYEVSRRISAQQGVGHRGEKGNGEKGQSPGHEGKEKY